MNVNFFNPTKCCYGYKQARKKINEWELGPWPYMEYENYEKTFAYLLCLES